MKKYIKYILLLAIGFFWCSGVYLTQEQLLLKYLDTNVINLIDMCIASFSMAFGILLFIVLYNKKKDLKKIYLTFLILSFLLCILFFIIKSCIIMSIILCIICFFGSAGFGIAYHLSIISLKVEKNYQGRVFGLGYSLGALLLWILSIIPGDIYKSSISLIIYLPCIIINYILIKDKKETINLKDYKKPKILNIKYLVVVVLLMSIVSTISSAFLDNQLINSGYNFTHSRLYYALGLIIVGYLADKKNNFLELLTIISLFYPLLTFIFLNERISFLLIYKLSYVFLAFLTVYRTIVFTNLSSNGTIHLAALGLMISRIIEGILTLLLFNFKFNNLVYITSIIILLSMIIIIIFINKENEYNKKINRDPLKELVVKYNITSAEEKVLELIIKNYTNQQIADSLFISINTVRNHISNIYKKTNMKKKDLKKIYYEKTI